MGCGASKTTSKPKQTREEKAAINAMPVSGVVTAADAAKHAASSVAAMPTPTPVPTSPTPMLTPVLAMPKRVPMKRSRQIEDGNSMHH